MTRRILLSVGLGPALSPSVADAQEAPRANINATKTRRLRLVSGATTPIEAMPDWME